MILLRLLDIIRHRAGSLFRRSKVERDLDRELKVHLEWQVEENLARGMSPTEARATALRSLGGLAQIQEECRDMRRTSQIETIASDLRYAIRTLTRTPGFSVVIILTLALAIGANSAIFSVIEGVLLRPLPYAQPDRIVRVFFKSESFPKFPLNPFDLRDLRGRNRTFDSLAGIVRSDMQLSGSGDPVMLRAFRVTSGYFRVLGFTPARGRDFSASDEVEGGERFAVLSDRLWRTRFASAPDIVGRKIVLNSLPFTVSAVMPPGVQHPGNDYHAVADGDTIDLWLPWTFGGNPKNRGSHFMEGIGRLKAGVSPEQGNADLSAILAQMANEFTGKGWQVYLVPLYREMVGRTQRMLLVLLAAVGLLLLIACVNAANLLLAKSSARVREIAVRSALGAARTRIVRQLLTESLVIALAGAALGSLFAVGGVRALVACLPPDFPRAAEIRLDAGVFAFTLLVAVATGLLFGLVPALTSSRTDLQGSLREGGRGATVSGRNVRLRGFLVMGETALACMLLIGAGLMLHSFVNLLETDPGFRPQQLLTASLSLPGAQYRETTQVIQFYDRLAANLQASPGVQAAGIGSDLPWTGYDENNGGFLLEGKPVELADKTTARYHVASLDYFRALGIPLSGGRFFTAHDDKKARQVLIVNQAFAHRYWPGEDAVGKRISFNDKPREKDWIQIVGVVGDVKDRPDSLAAAPAFWWPMGQLPFPIRNMSVAIRSNGDESQLAGQLRSVVRQLDAGLAIADLRMMDDVADSSVASHRFALFVIGLFAALALVLATIGIYGVISFSVNQRMHEFGMRMALGAGAGDLIRMIMRQGLALSLAGAVLGLAGAAALTRLMGSLLYGVSGTDAATFASVALLALVTTTFACYLPARRASQADPMRSLRTE